MVQIATDLKNDGKTLDDLLDEIWKTYGFHATEQISIRVNNLALILITVHLVECCVFYKRISTAEKNPVKGLFLTLVFGVLYIKDLKIEK